MSPPLQRGSKRQPPASAGPWPLSIGVKALPPGRQNEGALAAAKWRRAVGHKLMAAITDGQDGRR